MWLKAMYLWSGTISTGRFGMMGNESSRGDKKWSYLRTLADERAANRRNPPWQIPTMQPPELPNTRTLVLCSKYYVQRDVWRWRKSGRNCGAVGKWEGKLTRSVWLISVGWTSGNAVNAETVAIRPVYPTAHKINCYGNLDANTLPLPTAPIKTNSR